MGFARDAFAHEEAPFKMPDGAIFSWKTGACLGGGWLSRDSWISYRGITITPIIDGIL
jgi:hypothetical protein